MRGCRPLRDREIDSTLESFTGKYALRNRTLFILGLKTGFRINELVSLKIKDVYQNGRVLPIIKVQRKNTKGKVGGRIQRLNTEAQRAILELVESGLCDTYLFPSRQGGHICPKHASKIIKKAFQKADLDGAFIDNLLSTHSMRKTFAKKIYQNTDQSLGKTQDKLGHKHLASTVHYLSFDLDEQEDIDLMESV
jgi:integrase